MVGGDFLLILTFEITDLRMAKRLVKRVFVVFIDDVVGRDCGYFEFTFLDDFH